MILTQNLGGEIKNYIMNLLGKDSIIVNNDLICITSSGLEDVGKKVELPKEIINSNKVQFLGNNGNKTLYIPLDYQNERVATLVLTEEKGEIENYIPLIKSFAELLIQQYYENNKPILDSTDQFIIKLLNNANSNDFPFYESEAKVLGYDLSTKRIGLVIHLDGFLIT